MNKLFLILALALAQPALAEIREVPSYKSPDVSLQIQNVEGAKTWVIFDIDNTLLYPQSMIGSHQWGDYMRDQRLALGSSREVAEDLQHSAFSAAQHVVPVAITETAALGVIETLRKASVPTFALTARKEAIAPRTLEQICSLGFNFKRTFPELTSSDPSVHDGVVFSGTVPKGILLKRLIAASKVKPTKIIFFDDKAYNLESVEKELKDTEIEFLGFRYSHMDPVVASFRPDLANVEWVHFKQTGKVLSDSQAQELIFSN